MYDLTELGLTIEAAREMHDSEMEIKKVNELLREKRRNESQRRTNEPHVNQQVKDGKSDHSFSW